MRPGQLSVAHAGAQRHIALVDPLQAGLLRDVDGIQLRGIGDRQEQRRADDGRLRAHGRGARKGQRPGQLHVTEISGADARLLRRQVPVVVQVEAEIGHRRRHAEVDLAAARRAAQLRRPGVTDPCPADEEIDEIRALPGDRARPWACILPTVSA